MSDWTQPICFGCWWERTPDREASRVVEAETETCCHCGEPTSDGIYIRVDPDTVRFPTRESA